MIFSMIVFLVAGIWNTVLSFINFGRLFNGRMAAEAAVVLPTYVVIAFACFTIFFLLLKIKNLTEEVESVARQVVKCEREIKEIKDSIKNK